MAAHFKHSQLTILISVIVRILIKRKASHKAVWAMRGVLTQKPVLRRMEHGTIHFGGATGGTPIELGLGHEAITLLTTKRCKKCVRPWRRLSLSDLQAILNSVTESGKLNPEKRILRMKMELLDVAVMLLIHFKSKLFSK